MGYRSAWLNHANLSSRHLEVVLHAFEREIPDKPIDLLDAGVENGGSIEVWQQVLPEGSTVLGLDSDPACGDLGLPVLVGDVTDRDWLKEALRGKWFDVVVDSTETMQITLWPYLRAGGLLMFEGYNEDMIGDLVYAIATDSVSWLPMEEVMRVAVYPGIAVVEKRNPRVIPYAEILVGNFAEVVPEDVLLRQGIKRVVV